MVRTHRALTQQTSSALENCWPRGFACRRAVVDLALYFQSMRILLLTIFLLVGLFAAACSAEANQGSVGPSSESQPQQDDTALSEPAPDGGLVTVDDSVVVPDGPLVFVIDELPDDFPEEPLFVCTSDPSLGSVVGYRGLEARESEVYGETAFLRLFAQSTTTDNTFLQGLSGFNNDEISIDIGGLPGVSFTVSTAEPVLHPWPALSWEQDGAFIQMLGEGMDDQELLAAAISVRRASQAELGEGGLLDSVACE